MCVACSSEKFPSVLNAAIIVTYSVSYLSRHVRQLCQWLFPVALFLHNFCFYVYLLIVDVVLMLLLLLMLY